MTICYLRISAEDGPWRNPPKNFSNPTTVPMKAKLGISIIDSIRPSAHRSRPPAKPLLRARPSSLLESAGTGHSIAILNPQFQCFLDRRQNLSLMG